MSRKLNENSIKNLTDYLGTLTPEQHAEQSRKAGIESGKAKRKKKQLREYLELLLTEQMIDDMHLALIAKALQGDTNAYAEIRKTLGEDVKQVEVSTPDTININITGEDN